MYKNIIEELQAYMEIDIFICSHPGCAIYNVYHRGFMVWDQDYMRRCNGSYDCAGIRYCSAHIKLHLKSEASEHIDGDACIHWVCKLCEEFKKQ